MDAANANGTFVHASDSPRSNDTKTSDIPHDDTLRQMIVSTLSSTVNGCMKELGYFPGIVQAFQGLRDENNTLREQVGRLHSDNVNLSRIINQQREHIASLTDKPPAERDMEMEAMRRQVGRASAERDEAARAYQHLRMMYDQSRGESAELTAFIQQKMPGRIEAIRPGPTPMMVTSPAQHNGPPVMPPFIPGARTEPPRVSMPRAMPQLPRFMMGSRAPAGPAHLPSNNHGPMTDTRRVPSSIDTSMARISMRGDAASPVTPHSASPVVLSQRVPSISQAPSSAVRSRPGSSGSTGRPRSRGGSVSGLAAASKGKMIDLTTSEDVTMRDSDGPRKKRRVEEDDLGIPGANLDDVGERLVTVEGQLADRDKNESSAPTSEAAEDIEDEENIDPDGRRSEEACLAIAFEKDANDAMWCTMCKLRFNKNLTQQPPKAFLHATARELVEHCEKEHPIGWETLRGPPVEV